MRTFIIVIQFFIAILNNIVCNNYNNCVAQHCKDIIVIADVCALDVHHVRDTFMTC